MRLSEEMHCHDLEVMDSNLSRVELGACSTYIVSHIWTKNILWLLSYPISLTKNIIPWFFDNLDKKSVFPVFNPEYGNSASDYDNY